MSVRSVRVSWEGKDSFSRGASVGDGRLAHPLARSPDGSSVLYSCNTVPSSSYTDPRTARFEWLQPWRTPQDCREGGLALLYSMQEILLNVQQARLSSLNEVYAPLPSASTTAASAVDGGADSATLRLSMRNRKQRPPLSSAASAEDGEAGTESEVRNGSVVSEGSTGKRATLMDYVLSGSSSSTRQTSHMWLDESKSPQPGPTATPPTSEDQKDATKKESQGEKGPSVSDRATEAPSLRATEGGGGFALPAVLRPVAQRPTTAAITRDPPPIAEAVPEIPRFDELKAVQEEYQKQQETVQPPHPRSEAAQRKRRALLHSSEEDDNDIGDEGYAEDGSHDGSPRAPQQTTARLTSDADDGATSPLHLPENPRENDDEAEEEEEEEDAESDHMSATNVGEGGHLACVPGDTLHNRYTLLRALGVGRSSRVWLAADLEQCSLARRQLIRELGEREARRLFRPSERPMFVAIKVFRCGPMYTDCATYEAKLSSFVKDSVRLRQLRGLRSPLSRSLSLIVSLPAALVSPGSPSAAISNASSFASPNNATHSNNSSSAVTHPSQRLTTFRDAFTVEGEYGTHQCLVMDVLGSGVDKAINETRLTGFPSEVARSILKSSLQGLSVLAACNVIHTDLKPENLLFTDLEAEVAAAMSTFQSSQLQTGQRSGLWSSFTHRRENVLAYARRKEQETASSSRRVSSPMHHNDHPHDNSNNDAAPSSSCLSLTNSGSVNSLLHTHLPHAEETVAFAAVENDKAGTEGTAATYSNPQSEIHHGGTSRNTAGERKVESVVGDGRSSSSLTSPLLSATRQGRGSAGSSPSRTRRPAYEVRVSDFGLSFITPPCLRLGVRAVAQYADDVGITPDELVHDDALSQLQWLYEHQGQTQPPPPPHAPFVSRAAGQESNANHHSSSSNRDATHTRSPGWEFGVETALIDEAELRALRMEEMRDDDAELRRKTDAVGRQGNEACDDEEKRGAFDGSSDAAATTFTSVLDVGTAAEASQMNGRPASRRDPRQRQHTTQPDHPPPPHDTAPGHGSSSTDSTSDSLTAHGPTANSSTLDHIAVAPAAPAPPMALRTASYHSPVSHSLTALPSAMQMPSGFSSPPLPSRDCDRANNSTVTRPPSSPPLSLQNSFHEHQRPLIRHDDEAETQLYQTPQITQVAAPALLSGSSSAVEEDAERTATPTSVFPPAHSSSHRPPPLIGPETTANHPTASDDVSGRGSRTSALVSPRSSQRQSQQQSLPSSRRSSTPALVSLTALRRLELDIVRNQRYTRGATIQSREYRAPEVLLGNFFLPSCDVWSVGCIAYELVTGRFLIDCIADREHFGRQLARQQRDANASTDDEEDEGEEEVEWDGRPIYVDDDEQDLDVFHLKSVIRLLGPPPLSFLRQRPSGLFVEDYFDTDGNFKFWEDGEAEDCGVGLAEPYRLQELRCGDGQRRRGSGATTASGSGGGGGGVGDNFSLNLRSNNTNDEYYPYDDEEEEENEGRNGNNNDEEEDDGDGRSRVRPDNDRGTPSTDATPSILSMTPRSLTTSAMTAYLRNALTPAIAPASTPPSGSGATTSLQPLPHAFPNDTRNYPIETPDWVEIQQILRRKLTSAEEARDFEVFLWKCLQWDPAQRATAAELLADDWMVKYSDKVADTLDSDAEEAEGG